LCGVSLRASEFTGDEAEARHFVVSTNLRRRHLTKPQIVMMVRDLILPDAIAAATESHREGTARGRESRWSTAETAVDQEESEAPKKRAGPSGPCRW
jgi:hypothetical protein